MKHVLFLACAALCACSPTATPEATATASAAPAAAPASQAAVEVPAGASPDVAQEMPVLRFGLAAEGAKPALPVEKTEPSPCGPVARVRTNRIPWSDPALVPNVVVEFDASGRELRKWGTSYEAEVVALDGDRLRFRADTGTFWTDPAGLVEVTDVRIAARDAAATGVFTSAETVIECPSLDAFKGSSSVHCHRVRDAAGAERRIAVEGVCS